MLKQSKALFISAILAGAALLQACSSTANQDAAEAANPEDVITGVVSYREKIKFPEGATLKLNLIEISAEGKHNKIVTSHSHRLQPNQLPPYPFELAYDASKINASKAYSVQARLEISGKLRMLSVDINEAFAGDMLNIIMKNVGLSAARQVPRPNEEVINKNKEEVKALLKEEN